MISSVVAVANFFSFTQKWQGKLGSSEARKLGSSEARKFGSMITKLVSDANRTKFNHFEQTILRFSSQPKDEPYTKFMDLCMER